MVLTISNSWALPGTLGGLLLGVMLTLPASAQKYTPPPPPLTTAPCVPTKKVPCPAPAPPAPPAAAQGIPFPGEPPEDTTAAKAGTPAPSPDAAASAAAHPFPGEPPDDAGPSGSSSSSSSTSSPGSLADGDSADPPAGPPVLKDKGSSGSSRFSRKHLPKLAASEKDKEDRESEDLDVSRYYASTGDYYAAYLRAKDAVASVPTDPEAHFTLAEMAGRLTKAEEARTEYETYLKLEPQGEHVAVAKRALEKLGAKAR